MRILAYSCTRESINYWFIQTHEKQYWPLEAKDEPRVHRKDDAP